ncbi:MAG: C40 family peptidase [Treponema sp.]|nr:C40 family peptidase [Treponema sp.]
MADARLKLIATAESYLGTPYRYAGIDSRGLDCSGLVYISFSEGLGVTSPRTSDGIYTWTEKIETSELQPGDLVFFVTTGQRISHVGIYTGGGRFIHSASEGPQTGVMYSHLDEAYWKHTYRAAGRALPWNEETGRVMTTSLSKSSLGHSGTSSKLAVSWKDSGFFIGFGSAWTWGGFFEGAPSLFRGISTFATVGYKWSSYRASLQLRPEWDRALGVFRLPIALSFGTDVYQVFAGPAYTFGDPSLTLENEERYYRGGGTWLWEVGFSGATPTIRIGPGVLSIYGEMAWQPYHWEDGESFYFKPDITANLRVSTGIRYFWLFL